MSSRCLTGKKSGPQLVWLLLIAFTFGFFLHPLICSARPAGQKATILERLEQDLKKGLEYKRILVLEKLAQMGTPEARGLIIHTMLHDRSKPVRRAAQRMLEGVDDPRIARAIVAGLHDRHRKVRLAAVDVAGLLQDPGMAQQLLEAARLFAQDQEWVLLVLESLREMVYRLEPPAGFETGIHPFLQKRKRKIRITAVIILAILGRPASLPQLMDLWPKADRKLKIHLADAFANIGRIEPVELLVRALEEKDISVLLHSLYALAQIQSYSTVPKIQQLLKRNANPRIRMACLYALTEMPDPDSVPVIMEIFETQDPTTLHWAAYALGQLHAASAAPALLDKLHHANSLVRASAATALGELGCKEAAAALLERIADEKEKREVQAAAAKALVKIRHPQAAQVIEKELERPDLDLETRLLYAYTLGTLPETAAQERIAEQLQAADFSLALSAALMLAARGDSRGRPLLLTALEHGYPLVRRYAVLGLENIQDEEANRALADTANDDRDPLVRILCAASLVRAGFDDFRVILWNALETKKEDERSEAIIALGRTADAVTIRQLKWYLRREPSIPVRQTIQRVLREQSRPDKRD
ncbi:HEAT repeat domain-containing protein [candidate division FCPU426 bacterium]|nr:HEAT repeat domain-containing protein [candidate division FCPU426 bacterium]